MKNCFVKLIKPLKGIIVYCSLCRVYSHMLHLNIDFSLPLQFPSKLGIACSSSRHASSIGDNGMACRRGQHDPLVGSMRQASWAKSNGRRNYSIGKENVLMETKLY